MLSIASRMSLLYSNVSVGDDSVSVSAFPSSCFMYICNLIIKQKKTFEIKEVKIFREILHLAEVVVGASNLVNK